MREANWALLRIPEPELLESERPQGKAMLQNILLRTMIRRYRSDGAEGGAEFDEQLLAGLWSDVGDLEVAWPIGHVFINCLNCYGLNWKDVLFCFLFNN